MKLGGMHGIVIPSVNSKPVSSAVHCLNLGHAISHVTVRLILAIVVSRGGIACGVIAVYVFSARKTIFFTGGN